MLQLSAGTRHLNPFTEVVYQRGPRRWLGLKRGRLIRAERPAPWLLGMLWPPFPFSLHPLPTLGLGALQPASECQ